MAPDGARGCRASLPFFFLFFLFLFKKQLIRARVYPDFFRSGTRAVASGASRERASSRLRTLSLERVHSCKPCACIAFVMKKQLVFPNEP